MSHLFTIPYTKLVSLPPKQEVMYSPRLPTALEYRKVRSQFYFPSVVDSGADYCVFPANFGKRLGINIQSGRPTPMSGFGGKGHCFYHQVKVLVVINNEIWRFECFAGFSEQMNDLGLGLLGRHGFFELFEEVIFDQQRKVFKLKLPRRKVPKTKSTK